jgi:hypothetical protein
VMDVHRQVIRFEVARYCWTFLVLDKVPPFIEIFLNIKIQS